MSMLALFSLGHGLGALSEITREGLGNFAKRLGGDKGAQIFSKLTKVFPTNLAGGMPFFGPLRTLAQGLSRDEKGQMGFRTAYTTARDTIRDWRSDVGRLDTKVSTMEKQIRNFELSNIHKGGGIKDYARVQEDIRDRLVSTLKSNPRDYASKMYSHWNDALKSQGVTMDPGGVRILRNQLSSSAIDAKNIAIQAETSRNLMGAALASNAAVIGFPGLASTALTVHVLRAANRKAKRRMIGGVEY